MDDSDIGTGLVVGALIATFAICITLGVPLANSVDARDAAQREACSYRCLHDHGRWPARVEWLGRDEAGRIKCECLSKELAK